MSQGVEVADEPGLEALLVLHAEFGDPGLGGGGRLPLVLGALVAADVDERRGLGREEFQQFLQDALEEAQGGVGGGEDVRVDAPGVPDGEGACVDDVGVAEFGVGADRGL